MPKKRWLPMDSEIWKIEHDRNKKQIEYKNAILNVYDIPIFFPKFFHPDLLLIDNLDFKTYCKQI